MRRIKLFENFDPDKLDQVEIEALKDKFSYGHYDQGAGWFVFKPADLPGYIYKENNEYVLAWEDDDDPDEIVTQLKSSSFDDFMIQVEEAV